MGFSPPFTAVADTALGNKTVNMRIPFEVPAKSMENANEAGSKHFCFVIFMKHMQDNIGNGLKKASEEGTVF